MSDRNIRWAEVTEESADKGPYKLIKVKSDDHEMMAQVIEPYGVQGQPLKGGQVLLLLPDGDEGKALALVMPAPAKRTDLQKPGEVSYVNHDTGNVMKHEAGGDTIIKTKGVFRVNPG